MNVVSNVVVSNEHGLKCTWSQMNGSQTNWSQWSWNQKNRSVLQ